ncbi:MAG: histidine ammonia-lyase [Vulcanimicrobiota bacterium]
MNRIYIDGNHLTIEEVHQASLGGAYVEIHESALEPIEKSRKFLEEKLKEDRAHYGINTGFGDFAGVRISHQDLARLQINLVRSHSAGVGEKLPVEVVRAMMVLRANALCRGNSGVRREVIETLLEMYNKRIYPVVPSRGSVGASGDLAPLAHIALAMIGEGEVEYAGEIVPAREALVQNQITPVILQEKEGLALINGTQLMTAIGCIALAQMERLMKTADALAALTVEVLLGTDKSFIPQIQQARPHQGQIDTAENMLKLLKNSEIIESHRNCKKVQDPYSLRCIPAVHGAVRESMEFARKIFTTEINSSVDNPLLFPDEDLIVSGGNFHGAPVAIALESLAVALSFTANISERRTERMVNHHYSDLPPFLTRDGGLNSGFMIAQYTAAALASENKVLCHPACCDTIPTSAGQEDHVSMGSISALKLKQILENTWHVLAVEALCAAQAREFHEGKECGEGTRVVFESIRQKVPFMAVDRAVGKDILTVLSIIKDEGFMNNIEEKTGNLR